MRDGQHIGNFLNDNHKDSICGSSRISNATSIAIQTPPPHSYSAHMMVGGLQKHEYFWRDASGWLEEAGYKLRPRYRRDWVPSWRGSEDLNPYFCEDGRASSSPSALDAIRVSDGRIVTLKKVRNSANSHEEELLRFFSQQPMASDSRNHAVPLYDVLHYPEDDDVVFFVMPYLVPIREVKFFTIREAVECFRQLIEGLQYMHDYGIAYRAGMARSIMVDPVPLFSENPHPIHRKRSYDFQWSAKQHLFTTRPSRFFFTKFTHAIRYGSSENKLRDTPHCQWNMGYDPWPSEVNRPYDPFCADIFLLGRFLDRTFLQKTISFEFMRPLVARMMAMDPTKRPSINALSAQFTEVCQFQLQGNLLDSCIALPGEDDNPLDLYSDDKYQKAAQRRGLRLETRTSLSLGIGPSPLS
ncbi:hypothetical protein C8Q80DRAFT_874893 [Daedaleopsis nitida]|nr:hypothetical protein C8Q80DRAFT_874893 [Daedaleopsis nitida]